MFELFDLTSRKTRSVRLQLFFHDAHQEIQRRDVNYGHREDCRIREVDYRTKVGRGADDDEHAEHQLKDELGLFALAEQVRPAFEAIIRPRDHRREGEQHNCNCQHIREPADC